MLSTRRQQHRVWGCSGSCSCEAATLSCHYLHVTSEQADDAGQVFADIDPASFLPRAGQVQWDHYYMEVALTIRKRANCLHAKVGAVLVLENRIISTGFNGTPAGFPNCEKGGCERCKQQYYADIGDVARVTDPEFLDRTGRSTSTCASVFTQRPMRCCQPRSSATEPTRRRSTRRTSPASRASRRRCKPALGGWSG